MIPAIAVILIAIVSSGVVLLTVRLERLEAAPAVERAPVPVTLARRPENIVERFVVALKQRRVARFALSGLSVLLLAGAAGVVGYPFYTNLYQDRLQGELDRQLASPELRDAYLQRNVAVGDSLTRIKIPRIGVDVVVVEGTTASALRAGAGHYPGTPLPCEVGNVAIAGHRTTYGRPFHDLDVLEDGDRIILETPIGSCTYEFTEATVVTPTQTEVVENTPDEARLTLTTCEPKGSARLRLIVTANMVSAETSAA